MKKFKEYMFVCVFTVCILLSGCKNEENASIGSEEENVKTEEKLGVVVVDDTDTDIDVLDCVKLGNYKGLEVEKTKKEIGEKEIDEEISRIISNTQVTDGKAQNGDIVFVSYTASSDGEPLQDNFSAGTQLILGKSDMQPAFDEGIIGMEPGEAKDITVMMPKSYEESPELAGKEVVYHVILNSITRSYSELTEEWVRENTQFKTIEEYRNAVKENLEQGEKLNEQENYEKEVWEKILTDCTVQRYLKSLVDLGEKQYDTNIENYLAISGLDMEGYLEEQGITKEEYEQQREKDIKNEVEKKMIVMAIAEKENLSPGDDEYKLIEENMEKENQMTHEQMVSLYGEEELQEYIMEQRVLEIIMGNSER